MMDNSGANKEKQKKPLQILRERLGGVPKALTALHKEQREIRKKLVETLKDGPKTVPEIVGITGLQAHHVLFFITGMKKYGQVVEEEEYEGYYKYALKQEVENKEKES